MVVDVIGAGSMVHPEIGALYVSTNEVFRSSGRDYPVAPEPASADYANVRFMARYRRGLQTPSLSYGHPVRTQHAIKPSTSLKAAETRSAEPR